MKIPFGNLKRQYEKYKSELDMALQSVLDSGWFVLGKIVEKFEHEFAGYCGVDYAVGLGSGTEALHLALTAVGIGPGDEVITAANTCIPTVSAISFCSATPVLTDVDPISFNMSIDDLIQKITCRTKAIMPVHLYGQSADLDPILEIANTRGIPVIEDAAQAHGTKYKGKRIGGISLLTCFSFYPSKNLACFGDGGCVTTNSSFLAERLRLLRNYGQRQRFYHSIKGFNSRLDEMQAAILCAKLPHLEKWNTRRREIADMYKKDIHNQCVLHPTEMIYGRHVYHLYVIRVKNRKAFQSFLHGHGIETSIHYPVPVHLQECYIDLRNKKGDFPVTENLAEEIVSIPIYPELTNEEIKYVCQIINEFDPKKS